MPRAKLTPADRIQIAQRFRETSATATSLAAEYDVSISTVIRILKEELTDAVYESLVPQKRAGRWHEPSPAPPAPAVPKIRAYKPVSDAAPAPEPPVAPAVQPPINPTDEVTQPDKPQELQQLKVEKVPESPGELTPAVELSPPPVLTEFPATDEASPPLDSPALEEPETAGLPEWDADVQDDWDDEENDEEESPGDTFEPASISQQILPLEASVLPHTCYLVVDRFAELVARPLTEFSRWGELPVTGATARTLPVFDNHRVAKRFSGRGHRVLKVPDANLIYKTSGYLYDKGITHLLINGQVYTVEQPQSANDDL
ncbi:MAG: hypothetical protein Q6K90_07170 [Gloeomargarita sp. HHBFW_bins_162]